MNANLLTIEDLCHELGIGKTTAYKLIKDKKIKAAKVGNKLLISKKNLETYISHLMK